MTGICTLLRSYLLSFIVILTTSFGIRAQTCNYSTNGGTLTAGCSPGTSNTSISPGTYYDVSVENGQTYTFTVSSGNVNALCLTNTSNTALSSGGTSISWAATFTGTARLHLQPSVAWNWGSATINASIALPANPPAPTPSANPACGSFTLNGMTGQPTNVTYFWQGTSCGTDASFNANTTSPTYSSSGTYYVRARNASGCWSSGCGSVSVTVNTPSSGSSGITLGSGTQDQCNATPTAITLNANVATVGTGGTIQWYNGTGCTGSLAGTGASITPTPTANTNTSWSVRVTGACNSPTTCRDFTATHSTSSSGPTSISSSNGTDICNASPSTSLTANSVSLGNGGVLRWYEGATCSGTLLNSGSNPYSPTLAVNTTNTFSARVEGACNGNTACQSISIITRTPATALTSVTSTNGTSICSATPTTTLNANGGSAGANPAGNIRWYNTDDCSGSIAFTGASYTPTLIAGSTQSFSARYQDACNGNTTCQSITIDSRTPASGPSSISSSAGTSICNASPTTTLTANSATVGANPAGVINWYNGTSCSGPVQSTGATWSPSLPLIGSVSYSANITGACNGTTTCQNITLTISEPAVAPSSVLSSNGFDICDPNPTTDFEAIGYSLGNNPTGEVYWYQGHGCTGSIEEFGAFYTPVLTPGSSNLYSVHVGDACNNPTACFDVTVQARTPATDLTSISSSNGTNICSLTPSTTLTANGGSLGANPAGVVTWYDGLTCSGAAQATGTTWSPTLPGSGTVSYSANIVGACSGGSGCQSITITTSTASSGSSGITVSSGSATQCSNSPTSITFDANVATLGTGGSIEWYNGTGCTGSVAGTGPSLVVTPNAETTTSWSVRVVGACNSPTSCQDITATHEVPGDGPTSISSSAGTDICSATPSTSLTANSVQLGTTGVLRWYDGATCSGTLLNTGSNPYSPTLVASTSNVFSARVEGACNGNTACESITIETRTPATDISSISSSNGTAICSATPVTTLTANGGNVGANPAGTITWYSGASCGGAPISTGVSYAPTLTASSTESFSVRIVGACSGGMTCQSITITTSSPSTAPTGITQSGGPVSPECSATPSTISLDVVGGTLGDGGSYTWYTGSCGGSAVGTGASISTNPIAGSTTHYYVRIEGACNGNTACAGPFSYTHNISSQAPTSASVDVNNYCSNAGGTIELTASGGVIGTGAIAEWYTGGCGATPIGTGTTISIAKPTVTTTYYVAYVGGCNGATSCESVTVTVLPEPTADAGSTISTCTGLNDIFMTGSSAGGTYSAVNWTGGAGLGNWTVGTTDPATWSFTPSVSSGSFTATLTVTGSSSCTGTNPTSSRLIQWGTTPAAPAGITGPASICNGGGTLNLSCNSVAGATDYIWSLPPGATIVSGSGTNNISVDVSSVAPGLYTITVVARQVDAIVCASGPSPDFNLTVTAVPSIQTFLGGVSGDWNDLNNWSASCVPGCGGSALIDPLQYTNAPVISGTSAVRDIAFANSGNITVQSTAQFSVCGNITGTGSLAVSGGGWIGFVGTSNQNIAVSFVTGNAGPLSDVTISGSKTVTLDAGVTGMEVRDLTLTGGATLDVNGHRLFVQRNLNVGTGSTLNSGLDGVLEFIGAQAGTFDNQGTVEVENIEINKSNGAIVNLNSMLRATVQLTLTNGFVDATNAPLRVDNDDPLAIVGGANSSHIIGDLERAVNPVSGGIYNWPVGDGSILFPAQLDYVYTGEVTDYPYVSVAFVPGSPGSVIAPAVQNGRECGAQAGFVNVSGPGQWDVKGVGTGTTPGTYDLHLTLPAGTYTPCNNCSYTLLTRADLNPSTPWQLSGQPNCLGDNSTPNNLIRLGMTTFSGKGVGSTADDDPFPIELIALTATPESNSIRLNWSTGSERNNRGFEVQRSENMVNYDVLGFVIGAGNTNKQQNYLFADREVARNKRYFYRLRQVDFDGTFSFSPTVEAVITGESGVEVALYPNPTSGNVGLSLNLREGGLAEVRILNNLGQVVSSQQLEMTAGQNYHQLNTQSLTAGTYQVQVQIAGEMVTQRLVKFNN